MKNVFERRTVGLVSTSSFDGSEKLQKGVVAKIPPKVSTTAVSSRVTWNHLLEVETCWVSQDSEEEKVEMRSERSGSSRRWRRWRQSDWF